MVSLLVAIVYQLLIMLLLLAMLARMQSLWKADGLERKGGQIYEFVLSSWYSLLTPYLPFYLWATVHVKQVSWYVNQPELSLSTGLLN